MTTAQNVYAPVTAAPTIRYAGFGVRFVAYLIDTVILFVVFSVVVVVSILVSRKIDPSNLAPGTGLGIAQLACFAVGLIYYLYYWGNKGATPGKSLMGIRIRLQNGITGDRGIGQGKAFLRLVGYTINSLLFFLPFLMILANPQKRGLHDMIAGTEVVYN